MLYGFFGRIPVLAFVMIGSERSKVCHQLCKH